MSEPAEQQELRQAERRLCNLLDEGEEFDEPEVSTEEVVAISRDEKWTSAECARAWGVKTGTWLGYVSRGQAPPALPAADGSGPRLWAAEDVRAFPRPGAGRSRASATPEAGELLERMQHVAARMEELRAEQRQLLAAGKKEGLEILAMARALGISRQTAYSWLSET